MRRVHPGVDDGDSDALAHGLRVAGIPDILNADVRHGRGAVAELPRVLQVPLASVVRIVDAGGPVDLRAIREGSDGSRLQERHQAVGSLGRCFPLPVGTGDHHSLLPGKLNGEVKRGKARLGVDEECVGGERLLVYAASADAVDCEELVDRGLIAVRIQYQQDPARKGHQFARVGAEHRRSVALRAGGLPLDDFAFALAARDDGQFSLVGNGPRVLTVAPCVGGLGGGIAVLSRFVVCAWGLLLWVGRGLRLRLRCLLMSLGLRLGPLPTPMRRRQAPRSAARARRRLDQCLEECGPECRLTLCSRLFPMVPGTPRRCCCEHEAELLPVPLQRPTAAEGREPRRVPSRPSCWRLRRRGLSPPSLRVGQALP